MSSILALVITVLRNQLCGEFFMYIFMVRQSEPVN